MNNIIQLDRIQRNFIVGDQTVHALNQVNLEIKKGEYISIMGPSGSGKSTLLNLIGLLDRPTSGDYFLNSHNVTEMDEKQQSIERNKNIGFIFQSFHLVPRLTAFENIELPLILSGMEPEYRKEKVRSVLESTNLVDRAHHIPEQLSGGQRQRVAIARATIMQPNVLLADEPTGNLDQKSGKDVLNLLESLNESGITLIVVTHDLTLGNRAERLITLVDGKVQDNKNVVG